MPLVTNEASLTRCARNGGGKCWASEALMYAMWLNPLIAFLGSPFPIVVVEFNVVRASRGTGSMKHSLIQSITLFGTVAAMLTLTVVVTLFAW